MILHFSHIGFTDGLTFISKPPGLFYFYTTKHRRFLGACRTIIAKTFWFSTEFFQTGTQNLSIFTQKEKSRPKAA
jgi:hypothetical protein